MVAPEMDERARPEPVLSADEVRRRSVRGSLTVAARGLGVRSLGFLANIFLARLLAPRDFGLLALGLTFAAFASFLADGGLAASLIRSKERPTQAQLSATLALQLAITASLCTVGTAVITLQASGNLVTAALLWVVVLSVLRVPIVVRYERELDYRVLARVEVLETLVYAVLAVGLVAAGLGVWGVVVATLVRPVVGLAALQRGQPVTLPRWNWSLVRPTLAYGASFQASNVINLVRDQGVNLVTVSLLGTVGLGLWSLTQRLMLVPFLVFETLWRVSFPGIARLLEAGADVREDLTKALRVSSFATALCLVPLASASTPLVIVVFGPEWREVGPLIPLVSLGLLIVGPLSAVGTGYFAATGRLRVVILAQLITLLPWFLLTPFLLPRLGILANGIGWLVACVLDAVVLGVALHREADVRVLPGIARLVLAALLATAPYVALTRSSGPHLGAAVGAPVAATAIYLLLTAVLDRGALLQTGRVLSKGLSRAQTSGGRTVALALQ